MFMFERIERFSQAQAQKKVQMRCFGQKHFTKFGLNTHNTSQHKVKDTSEAPGRKVFGMQNCFNPNIWKMQLEFWIGILNWNSELEF